MIITRGDDGMVTLRSGDETEVTPMKDFFSSIPDATELGYGGRRQDPVRSGFSCPIFEYHGWSLTIIGTSEADARVASQIRDLCYFGSDTKISLIKQETDGRGLILTLMIASPCNGCGQPIVEAFRAEWGFCPTCIEQCDHDWVRGAVHGGTTKDGQGLDIGVGQFCSKCGTGRPDDGQKPADKTLAEHHLDAIQAGVVDAIISL